MKIHLQRTISLFLPFLLASCGTKLKLKPTKTSTDPKIEEVKLHIKKLRVLGDPPSSVAPKFRPNGSSGWLGSSDKDLSGANLA